METDDKYRQMMLELSDLTGDGWAIHLSLAPDAARLMNAPLSLTFRRVVNGIGTGPVYGLRVNRFALAIELPDAIHRFHTLAKHSQLPGGKTENGKDTNNPQA